MHRDEQGHFISEEEARKRDLERDEEDVLDAEAGEEGAEETETPRTPLREGATRPQGSVWVDVGRGDPIEVPVGSPFIETLDRLAQQAHYGGDYRVFLNGSEVLYTEEAPATIETGQRIAITSYDKPGK